MPPLPRLAKPSRGYNWEYATMLRRWMHLLLVLWFAAGASFAAENAPPNLVVIFIDDLGYADIGPFGATRYPTANLDRLAREGRCLTDFHAATAVCSASRAALLTGCYPERVSILGALGPNSRTGIHSNELTLAELCHEHGYATAIFGKWHLGDSPQFLPTRHGFDQWLGLPYSNDMWPLHPAYAKLNRDAAARKQGYPDLPLFENEQVIDAEVTGDDQAQLTRTYTERAVQFIEQHAERPFFLYLPHSMVHVPLFASERFAGQSGAGLFADVMQEVDWSVGQVLETLDRCGVSDNTLVVFTSDNGPWLSYGEHAGSAGPLREGKGTMFEGGYRVPCIVRWPGQVPAGTRCDTFCTTMDLLPTMAALLGHALPAERPIDGHDIAPVLRGDADTPYDAFACYYDGELRAVRDERWKLHLPHTYRTLGGKPGGRDGEPVNYQQVPMGQSLYDLDSDLGETTDVSAQHPDVVARLLAEAERFRAELGDRLTKRKGSGVRASGRLPAR